MIRREKRMSSHEPNRWKGFVLGVGGAIRVAGRGKFYEEVGAIRDVVQNHMLQLVALLKIG
jgi:hypothetical protein